MCGEGGGTHTTLTLATIENKLTSTSVISMDIQVNVVNYFYCVSIMRTLKKTKSGRCSVTRCSGAPYLKQTNNEIMELLSECLLLGSPCGQIEAINCFIHHIYLFSSIRQYRYSLLGHK